MYSYDDRIRAVRLYIQYDKSADAVIRELGYPERKPLRYWFKEYLRDNGLKKKFVRSPKYDLRKSSFGHRNTTERRRKPR